MQLKAPITYNIYDGDKLVFKTKSATKASDYRVTNGKHLSIMATDSIGNTKKLYADGGGVGELKVGDKVELRMGGDSKRGVVVSPPSNGKVSVEVEFTDVLSKRLTKMKMAFPISSIHKLSTMANGGGVETESTLRKRFEGYTDEELQIYNGDNAETLKNWNRKDAIQEAIDAVNEEGEEEEKFTYKDIYTSQGGMTFETEEEVKKFIKRTKPFIRKQLKEGNFVVVFNGKEYYIAEKIKHNKYAKGSTIKGIKPIKVKAYGMEKSIVNLTQKAIDFLQKKFPQYRGEEKLDSTEPYWDMVDAVRDNFNTDTPTKYGEIGEEIVRMYLAKENKYADGGGVDSEWTVTIVYPSDNKRSGWSSDEVVDINVLANSYQSAEQKAMDKFKKTHSGKKGRVTSVNSNTHKFLDNAKLSKGSTIKNVKDDRLKAIERMLKQMLKAGNFISILKLDSTTMLVEYRGSMSNVPEWFIDEMMLKYNSKRMAKGSTIKGEKEYVVYGSVSSDENYQNFSKIVTANDEDEAIEKVVEWADIEYEYLWDVPQIELEFDLEARERMAKGSTVKGGGEGEFWAVASGRKLMGAFPNKKPKQSQYRLVGTGHGWNIKPYAEVQKEGAKDREFEKWELVKEPTDYYLIVKHDYTSGRETNFYQKPKNKYVNGGNTTIQKQKMETINETRNKELNELKKLILKEETDKVLFLTVEEIEEIQSLIYKTEDRSLSKEESKKLFIKAIDSQIKKQINGKTYYTIGYTARGKGRNYSWNQATEILYKLHKMGVDAIICQFIPLFNPIVPKSVHDFSFSVLTSPMLSYNSYKELVGGSESVGEQGDPKNNYYEDGGNTSSGYSYSIGGL